MPSWYRTWQVKTLTPTVALVHDRYAQDGAAPSGNYVETVCIEGDESNFVTEK